MLTKILANFSQDELLSFLPLDAINFALAIDSDKHQLSESVNHYNKQKLVALVASAKKVNFLFEESLRKQLIERLSPQLFIELFPEFEIDQTQVKAKHYDAAISWSEINPYHFASRLGLNALYVSQVEQKSLLSGISRIEPNYSLYPYQQDISQQVFTKLNNGCNRVLLHLPTGAGKTRTAMNIASEHLRQDSKNVVLWLADREELCSQAFNEFSKAWQSLGNRPTTLYGFYSTADESLGGIDSGFVVGGLHKFLSLRSSNARNIKLLYSELCKKVTLVIFDEAHKAVAPMFKEVINDFILNPEFHADLIGLTATPGRSYSPDGLSDEDALLSSFFNNVKVSMRVSGYLSPIDYLVEKGYLAKANFKPLTYDSSAITAYELRDAGGAETMKTLADNVERNRQIVNTIIEECEKQSQIIVFACTVEHGVNLSMALNYQGINAASIDSKNDSASSRRAKIEQYKNSEIQVLVNFNVLTAGFDAPKTNVTIIAKPMNSLVQYLQMAGRAMRGIKSGGNNECNIYTVMDNIPEFQSISIAFGYWNDMWIEKD
ncbi:DEAD/DEAH box helicase [Shewanella sp. SG44-6]|uniref:DEAD/DEAH box helicase n=1 Tax=Shewanella sp. SG44-6 TaxID=2760959 RepID=UPI001603B0BD|nr:DEAD/DEAH box helicase [Shewanella sp. SG44-6]MBB1390843.1 DEAD/DEAH box helicase [Shewanella sp. SG44-6]